MIRWSRATIVTLFLLSVAAAPAFAGLGLHLGGSIDPDDFIAGLRFKSHPIQDTGISVVPSAEIGFGDVTMIDGNLDGHFNFNKGSKWNPYLGAGLTLVWYDFDGGSNTEFGGSILGGFDLNEKWFFEAKIGLGDVPDWRFVVGFEKP